LPKVEIYTSALCGFCHSAKRLLTQKSVAFDEIPVDMDAAARATMRDRAGGRNTVPQIFIDGTHVGGCDDLYMLEQEGKLDPMLVG
jgi:glutaredoxin 3